MTTKKWTLPSSPNEITPLPWLAPDAIAYLESLLRPDMEVIEFGGGGSTLWFAERVAHVTTHENKPEWLAKLQEIAPPNVKLTKSPVMERGGYDLLFIDGDPVQNRAYWIDAATEIIRRGGYVVLDNANRPEYASSWLRLQSQMKMIHRVQTQGGKYFVTEFYQWQE
jgi:predicted O-methyltransferase YrrM